MTNPSPSPISVLTPSGEVCVCVDDNQFGAGQSVMKCGYEAVALVWHSVKPGTKNPYSSTDIHTMAHDDYVQFAGPDTPLDYNGMTNQELYDDLAKHGLHYQSVPMDYTWLRGYLKYGYPIIAGIYESSVIDVELGRVPYSWDTAGFTHIIVFTGEGTNASNLRVRDTANIGATGVRPGPRLYDTTKLRMVSATAVIPSWLPVIPAGFDPRVTPAPIPPPPPVPAPATLFVPSAEDILLWNMAGKNIALNAAWSIPQSWLKARRAHIELGMPYEAERATAPDTQEQMFGNAIARWNRATGKTTWYDSRGVCFES